MDSQISDPETPYYLNVTYWLRPIKMTFIILKNGRI